VDQSSQIANGPEEMSAKAPTKTMPMTIENNTSQRASDEFNF